MRFGLGLGIATFQGRFIDRLPSLRAGAEAARPRPAVTETAVTIIPPRFKRS